MARVASKTRRGGIGPLILLGVAVVFVLVLVAEKKWRRRKPRHNAKGS